jgi:hypothetical protein
VLSSHGKFPQLGAYGVRYLFDIYGAKGVKNSEKIVKSPFIHGT